jgi:hypothetical protein
MVSDRSAAPRKSSKADAKRPVPAGRAPAAAPAGDRAAAPRGERWLVALLCVAAAARVAFGVAALPFFADTDEDTHFDLVHKFARGEWPGATDVFFDRETIDLWAYDASPEYINGLERFPFRRVPPPLRRMPDGPEKERRARQVQDYLRNVRNHEAHEPPAYYALARLWYGAAGPAGLSDAASVYWVRLLNVVLYAALVPAAYAFARPYFGGDVAVAAAALTAFFPNPIFFTVDNDVPSPLAGVLALGLLFRWYEAERPARWLGTAVGVAAAAAVLVKLVNAAILVAVGAVILLRLRRDRRPGTTLGDALPVAAGAALPLFLWGLRNRLVLGDWTGTAQKTAVQTWTPKPVAEWLDHPIFSADGLLTFLKTLVISLFGGDSGWHARPVHYAPGEIFFLITAGLLPAIGLVAALRRGRQDPRLRFAACVCAVLVAAYVAELAYVSIRWDFGNCPYPSRKFPYLAYGRLTGGALVAYLILYALGIRALLGRQRRPALLAVATAVPVLMMVLMQRNYLNLVLASQYNWFHLR